MTSLQAWKKYLNTNPVVETSDVTVISYKDAPQATSVIPSDIEVGQRIQFCVLCVTAAIAAIYTLGYVTGEFVHNSNEKVTKIFKDPQYFFVTTTTKIVDMTKAAVVSFA